MTGLRRKKVAWQGAWPDDITSRGAISLLAIGAVLPRYAIVNSPDLDSPGKSDSVRSCKLSRADPGKHLIFQDLGGSSSKGH